MKQRALSGARLLACAGLGLSLPAMAGPPTIDLLLQHGDTPTGSPDGRTVTSIRTTCGPTRDRFAAMIELDGEQSSLLEPVPLSAVWGVHPDPGPDGTRQVLVYEQAPTGTLLLDEVRFEDVFGYTAQGLVARSSLVSVGACSPMSRGAGLLDSAWVGSTLLALGGSNAPDTLAPAVVEYASISRPGITSAGHAYWLAGTKPPADTLPDRHALYIETSGGPVRAWVQTDTEAAGSTVRSLGPYAVSNLGGFALCIAGLDNGDQVALRAEWDGTDPLVYPLTTGSAVVGKNRLLSAVGNLTGERWRRLLHVGAAESTGQPSQHWFVVAETSTTNPQGTYHAVVMSNGLMNFVHGRSDAAYGDRTIYGPPLHVAMNAQGDVASVWNVEETAAGHEGERLGRQALFVNQVRVLETGGPVPVGGEPNPGALTNFPGRHWISISGRDAEGVVSVFFVGNVDRLNQGALAEHLPALYRLNFQTESGTPCSSDWNLDGNINSSDISVYLTDWLEDLQLDPHTTVADFNGDGVTNSTDISAFLTDWLAGVSGGC